MKNIIELYLTTETPKIVPNNAYWMNKVTDPIFKNVWFLDCDTSKMVYAKEYLGFEIHEDVILIKTGRYTFKDGKKIEIRGKRVKCLNNGITYTSAATAEKKLGLSRHSVSRPANGLRDNIKGYKFIYV